jgi:hypothetical protein
VVVGSMGRVSVASMLDAARVRAIADASAEGMVDPDERVEMGVEPPQPPIRASRTRRLATPPMPRVRRRRDGVLTVVPRAFIGVLPFGRGRLL